MILLFESSACFEQLRAHPEDDSSINPLNAELNPICYLLALLAHHFLHVIRIRVKSLTLRLLMSYIYIYIYDINSLRVNTTSGIITLCYWPSGMQVKMELQFHLGLHTGWPLTQSDYTRRCIHTIVVVARNM